MSSRFVGRAHELRRVVHALRARRCVTLGGVTGAGRSRLLAEVLRTRTRTRETVLTATASPATATIPLSPFIPLLDADPPEDPALLLAAILRSVRGREQRAGSLLVAVDDAQHLDDASVALLATLLGSTSTRLLMTLRTEAPAPPALSDLLATHRAEHVELGPLARAESDELLAALLGDVAPGLQDRVWRATRGNPLMLVELVADVEQRLVHDGEGRVAVSGRLPTDRLAELARSRLLALSPAVGHVVELLAVAGPLPEGLLLEIVPGSAIDEVTDVGLAVRTLSREGVALVGAVHPLYSEVLRDATGESRTRALHRELLAGAAAAPDPGVDPLRAATWQLHSGEVSDVGLAVTGVRAAIVRNEITLAGRILDDAAAMLPVPVEAMLRSALLIRGGRAAEAEDLLARVDLGELDEELFLEFVLTRAFNLAFELARPDDADELLSTAEERSRWPAVSRRLSVERALIGGISGDFSDTTTSARQVLADVDIDDATRTSAYLNLVTARCMRGRCDQLHELVDAGLQAAEVTRDEQPFMGEHIELMAALATFIDGDLAGLVARARSARDDPHRGSVRWLWQTVMSIGQCATGELDEAAALLELADEAPLVGMYDLAGLLHGAIGMVAGQSGSGEALDRLEELRLQRDDLQNAIWLDRGRAWTRAALGDVDVARDVLLEAAHRAVVTDHHLYATLLLHDAVRLGPHRADREIADELTRSVSRMTGARLGDLMGRHGQALADRDPGELLKVAGGLLDHGARLLAADAAAQAATLHRDAGEDRLAARAGVLCDTWLLTMPGAATPALTRRPDSAVSARVLTVLLAAAAGATSREIADELFLSPRTVDNHLRTGYRKLHLAGRAELADLLGPSAASRV